jgi:hypothetical protein
MPVLHGDADQVLPPDKAAKCLPGLIHDVQFAAIEGGPHAIPWTHARPTRHCPTSCAADTRPQHDHYPGRPAQARFASLFTRRLLCLASSTGGRLGAWQPCSSCRAGLPVRSGQVCPWPPRSDGRELAPGSSTSPQMGGIAGASLRVRAGRSRNNREGPSTHEMEGPPITQRGRR